MKLWVLEKMVVAVAYLVSSKIMLNALQHLKEFSTEKMSTLFSIFSFSTFLAHTTTSQENFHKTSTCF